MNLVFLELPVATFEMFTCLLKELPAGWNVSISEETVTQPASEAPPSSLQDLLTGLTLSHSRSGALPPSSGSYIRYAHLPRCSLSVGVWGEGHTDSPSLVFSASYS